MCPGWLRLLSQKGDDLIASSYSIGTLTWQSALMRTVLKRHTLSLKKGEAIAERYETTFRHNIDNAMAGMSIRLKRICF